MSHVTQKEWYRRVNETWPAGNLPSLQAHEAVVACRKLYRFALGTTWAGPVRVTSGNRYTWVYRGEMRVNPSQGWRAMVHSLSHYLHMIYQRDNPEVRGHGADHARMEIRCIKEVIERGWLTGSLREPVPAFIDPKAAKRDGLQQLLLRAQARLLRWERKQSRAITGMKKAKREIARIDRALSKLEEVL